jgi:hypothetical protein
MSETTADGRSSAASHRRENRYLRLSTVLLFTTVLFGIALRIYLFNPDIARSPDERTYTRQADIVLALGTEGFRFLGREAVQDPAVTLLFPPPTRAGYLAPLAAFMRLTGDTSVLAGAHLSLLCSLAALPFIAFTAYRALSPIVAIAATLFYSVFPFDLTIFRRAWQESFIAFLAIVIVSLAVYIVRARPVRRIAGLVAFTILGVLSVTTKENLGIFFLLCGAGLTLHLILQRDRPGAVLTASSTAAAILIGIAILAYLFGGLAGYAGLEREITHQAAINPYDLQFDRGPAWMYPAAFFRTSPVLVLAATVGFVAILYRTFRHRARSNTGLALGVALISLSMVLIQLLTQRYNFRYTAPVYGPICILGGIGIEAILPPLHKLLAPLGRTAAWAILGFALAIAALRDLDFAQNNFLLPGLQDLALRWVLGVPPAPLPGNGSR